MGCVSLNTLSIKDIVKKIEEDFFYLCDGIETKYFPEKLTKDFPNSDILFQDIIFEIIKLSPNIIRAQIDYLLKDNNHYANLNYTGNQDIYLDYTSELIKKKYKIIKKIPPSIKPQGLELAFYLKQIENENKLLTELLKDEEFFSPIFKLLHDENIQLTKKDFEILSEMFKISNLMLLSAYIISLLKRNRGFSNEQIINFLSNYSKEFYEIFTQEDMKLVYWLYKLYYDTKSSKFVVNSIKKFQEAEKVGIDISEKIEKEYEELVQKINKTIFDKTLEKNRYIIFEEFLTPQIYKDYVQSNYITKFGKDRNKELKEIEIPEEGIFSISYPRNNSEVSKTFDIVLKINHAKSANRNITYELFKLTGKKEECVKTISNTKKKRIHVSLKEGGEYELYVKVKIKTADKNDISDSKSVKFKVI